MVVEEEEEREEEVKNSCLQTDKGEEEQGRPLLLAVGAKIHSMCSGCESSRQPHGSRRRRIVEQSSLQNDIDSG